MIVLRLIAALVVALPLAAQSPAGTWDGKLYGQPAVTLTVKSSADGLSGTVIFYLLRRNGDDWRVAGQVERPLLKIRFECLVLSFQVDHRDGNRRSFEMKLSTEDEGDLRPTDPGEEPLVVRMIRSPSARR